MEHKRETQSGYPAHRSSQEIEVDLGSGSLQDLAEEAREDLTHYVALTTTSLPHPAEEGHWAKKLLRGANVAKGAALLGASLGGPVGAVLGALSGFLVEALIEEMRRKR